jgi:hypothetical protein
VIMGPVLKSAMASEAGSLGLRYARSHCEPGMKTGPCGHSSKVRRAMFMIASCEVRERLGDT